MAPINLLSYKYPISISDLTHLSASNLQNLNHEIIKEAQNSRLMQLNRLPAKHIDQTLSNINQVLRDRREGERGGQKFGTTHTHEKGVSSGMMGANYSTTMGAVHPTRIGAGGYRPCYGTMNAGMGGMSSNAYFHGQSTTPGYGIAPPGTGQDSNMRSFNTRKYSSTSDGGNPWPTSTRYPAGAGTSSTQNVKKAKSDLYALFGLAKNCTQDEIVRKHKELMLKHHPNRVQQKGGNDADIDAATKKAQEINQAYDVLKDTKRRKCYDKTGETSEDAVRTWELRQEMEKRGRQGCSGGMPSRTEGDMEGGIW